MVKSMQGNAACCNTDTYQFAYHQHCHLDLASTIGYMYSKATDHDQHDQVGDPEIPGITAP